MLISVPLQIRATWLLAMAAAASVADRAGAAGPVMGGVLLLTTLLLCLRRCAFDSAVAHLKQPLLFWATAFFALIWLSRFTSTARDMTDIMGWSLAVLPLGVIVLSLLFTLQERNWLLKGAIAVSLLLGAVALYLSQRWGTRVIGPLLDPNAFSALIYPFAVLACGFFYAAPDSRKGMGWLLVTAALAAICFSTQSRAGNLLLVLGIAAVMFTALMRLPARRSLTRTAWLVLPVLLLSTTLLNQPDRLGRLASIPNLLQQGDAARTIILEKSWELYRMHPWWGTGIGTYSRWYGSVRSPGEQTTTGMHVHNDYLEILIENGPLGLAFLAFIPIWAAVRYVRLLLRKAAPETDATTALLPLVTLIALGLLSLHALANFIFYVPLVGLVTALLLACSTVTPAPVSGLTPATRKKDRRLMLAGTGLMLPVATTLALNATFSGPGLQSGWVEFKVAEGWRYPVAKVAAVLAPYAALPHFALGRRYEIEAGNTQDPAEQRALRESALAHYAKMIRAQETHQNAHELIGDLLMQDPTLIDRLPGKLHHTAPWFYQRAITIQPYVPSPYIKMVAYFTQQQDWPNVWATYREALRWISIPFDPMLRLPLFLGAYQFTLDFRMPAEQAAMESLLRSHYPAIADKTIRTLRLSRGMNAPTQTTATDSP